MNSLNHLSFALYHFKMLKINDKTVCQENSIQNYVPVFTIVKQLRIDWTM